MVLKGAAARKLKKVKLEGRPERTLYVSFRNRTKRERIVEILESVHPDVERVFLPREKLPKFVYVLCKGVPERDSVRVAINHLRNEDLGHIYATNPRPKKVEEKSPLSSIRPKRVIDRRTLLVERIPSDLDTEEIQKAFPEATKVDRFDKLRCFVHFKKANQAMNAKILYANGEIAGHKLTIKFNKIKPTETAEDEGTSTQSEEGADKSESE